MRDLAIDFGQDIKQSLAKWSWMHFFFDAGLTLALTTIIGWTQDMPWPVLLALAIGIGMAVTGAVELYRRDTTEPRRLLYVQSRLRSMAENIPVKNPMVDMVTAQVTRSMMATPRDWQAETVAVLRALIRPDLLVEYEGCLQGENANEPARLFLKALAENLTRSDLRGRPLAIRHPATQL